MASENPYLARLAKWLKELETVHAERGAIYGDPVENHKGIAMMIAPLLQPHWEAIRDMKPIPASTVCCLLVAVKLNRMRRVRHEDNPRDLTLYAMFADVMQEAEQGEGRALGVTGTGPQDYGNSTWPGPAEQGLRDALQPFAELGREMGDDQHDWPDDEPAMFGIGGARVTGRDFRRAAAVLKEADDA